MWLGFALLLLMVRLEEQLYLVATAVGCLLTAAVVALHEPGSARLLRFPSGCIALLATLHLAWLFTLANFGSMPFVSYWIAWIIGLLPIGYLIGRQTSAPAVRLWSGLAAFALALAIWACGEYLVGAPRVRGPFLDWNAFGALLYVFLLPAIAVHCDPRRSAGVRNVCLIAMTLGLFALFATYSRAATTVMLLMSVVVFFCVRRSGLAVAGPVLRFVMLAAACYAAVKLYPADATSRDLDVVHDPSMLFRLMMWKSAWRAWLDHPWLGTGIGTYRLQYLHYRLPTETDTSGDLAHNDYLQMLMEGGPMLLGFLLAWGMVALWMFVRLWQAAGAQNSAPDQRLNAVFALSLIAAVLGLFAHAGINFIFYVAPLSFLAGLYLSQAHLAIGAPEPRRFKIPLRGSLVNFGFGLAISLIVGSLLADWAASELLTPTARQPAVIRPFSAADKTPEDRYAMAAIFEAVRPYNAVAQQTLAVTSADLAISHREDPRGALWAQLAIEHGKRWLEVSRDNPLAYITLARLAWSFPGLQTQLAPVPSQPDLLLRLGIENYPALPDGYRLLSGYLRSHGQSSEALKTLWSALIWSRIPVTNESVSTSWSALVAEGRQLGSELSVSNPTPEILSMTADFEHFDKAEARPGAVAPLPKS